MGKQFWIGVFLLVLLLGLGIGTAWGMAAIHEPAEQVLEQAAQMALEGDMTQAVKLARQAHARWDRFWQASAAVADHNPMDQIDSLFAEMESYAQAQNKAYFAACCAKLSKLVKSMADAHALTWWNLL